MSRTIRSAHGTVSSTIDSGKVRLGAFAPALPTRTA
jgi:hypothetical protein